MHIWIDLVNSPHVLIFHPMIKQFMRRGHEVVITLRDFAQTRALADQYQMSYGLIGVHGGRNIIKKGLNILGRAWALTRYIKDKSVDLALSHNSYAQVLAARWLKIPVVTMMDYEFQPANHLSFRLADKIMVPALFPTRDLKRLGAPLQKVIKYHGIKEEIYLADFRPQADYLDRILTNRWGLTPGHGGTIKGKIIVTLRPPATMALYHRFENPLFEKIIEYLAQFRDVVMIVIPRDNFQKEFIRQKRLPNLYIPDDALDGPNLIYHSDLVISAGGTMNREAAVLGTPVYSIYRGKIGAIDRNLMQNQRMIHLTNEHDLGKINIAKKKIRSYNDNINQDNPLLRQVVDEVLRTI